MRDLIVNFGRIPHVLLNELRVSFLSGRLFPRLVPDLITKCVDIVQLFPVGLFFLLHTQLSLFDQRGIFSFLEHNFAAQLHEVVVSLLQDLHESGVLLRVDHVDVRIHVVVLQGLDALTLLFIFLILWGFLFYGGLCEVGHLPYFHMLLFVKFDEVFLMVCDGLKVLLVFHLLADHCALTHLHFESVLLLPVLLRVLENCWAAVEIPIGELSFEKLVTSRWSEEPLERHFVL